jgi:magnesium chelatase family protein
MYVVGLPDASVKESRERVIAALSQFGEDVTDQKVVANLSPPEQKNIPHGLQLNQLYSGVEKTDVQLPCEADQTLTFLYILAD